MKMKYFGSCHQYRYSNPTAIKKGLAQNFKNYVQKISTQINIDPFVNGMFFLTDLYLAQI